jgi:Calcineurin-like phosphoesterase/Divergent InlB B-repeat domain
MSNRYHGTPWVLTTIALMMGAASTVNAQSGPASYAIGILTQNDGGYCDPQHGADNGFYSTGCCGSPGNRECGQVLHFGKGSWGSSPGCTDPDGNVLRWSSYDSNLYCQLPDVQPEVANLLPTGHLPGSPRDFQFIVTSDLHFYRIWFNLNDQVNHVQRINGEVVKGALAGHPYTAVIVPGDITTGGSEERLGAYRSLWERYTLGQASIGLPVYFGLGNHDASALSGGFGTDSTGGQRMWEYLDARMANMHIDTSPDGCLANIDPGCASFGSKGGSHNYSWDWEGVHMVMLNTWAGDTDRAYSPPNGMQGLKWLTRDLDYYVGNSGRPVILFQHYAMNDAGSGPPFSTANREAFKQVIGYYNVIGLFSGHSHDLSFNSTDNGVNQSWYSASGPGTVLDNFVDGAGGDCYHHGDGQYQCANAVSNYLTVHVTDHYMDVTANSWQGSTPTWVDSTIGMRGPLGAAAGTCRKRTSPHYRDVSDKVSVSVDTRNSQIVVTNQLSTAISGAIAIQVTDAGGIGLGGWDFLDSCDSGKGLPYLLVSETGLAGASTAKVTYRANGFLSNSQIKVFQLNDSLSADTNAPVLGTSPVTVKVWADSSIPVPFTYSVDPYYGGGTQWLHVSVNQTTTPATFTLTADNLPFFEHFFASFTVTPDDVTIPPFTVRATLAPSNLNVTTNVAHAQMNLYSATVAVPYSIVVSPGNAEKLDVPSPQYPSAGIRYTFDKWTDGQAQQHYVTVPIGGLTLGLNFKTSYLVTPTITPANGGRVDMTPSSTDGYYPAGNTHFKAVPNPNFHFVGYSNGLTGTAVNTDADLEFPLTFTATFAANASVTVSSNVPGAEGSKVTLNGVTSTAPVTTQFAPGTTVSLSVPASFTSSTNPGIQYIFQQWSDGVTASARGTHIDTGNLAFSAQYKTQYLVTTTASPSDAGSVTGGGWYDSAASVSVQATPAAGFKFSAISGDLTSSASPLTFAAAKPVKLVANFAPTGVPQIYASTGGAAHDVLNGLAGFKRVVPINLTDAATAGAIGVQIDSVSNIQVLSGSGTVTSLMAGPLGVGDLLAGASATASVPFIWPASATRVRLTVNFSAGGGAYKSSTTLNLFR